MTPATEKPLRRLLTSPWHKHGLVVELTTDSITVREKGTRRGGGGEVTIMAGALFDRLILQRAGVTAPTRKGRRR